MALKLRPDSVGNLITILSPKERQDTQALYDEVKKHGEKNLKIVAAAELNKLSLSSSGSYLKDVHNDWILEILLGESPEMIALVLRHLPADRVSHLLDALPPEILTKLPKMSDTFAIPMELVEHLRRHFEKLFTQNLSLEANEEIRFEHIPLLSHHQLERVFLDLGYREIALGLASLPSEARAAVIERLSAHDRKYVEICLQEMKNDVTPQRMKRAQVHLVSKEIDAANSTLFVKELGFLFYAKSLLKGDESGIEIIKKKMSKQEAAMLQELIDNHRDKNTEALVVAYREDVMLAVKKSLGA